MTWGDIIAGSRRFAALYRNRKAKPGDVVFISLETGVDLYHAFLGALWVGCIPAMMPFPSRKQNAGLFWDSHRTLFSHLGGGDFRHLCRQRQSGRGEDTPPGLLTIVTPDEAQDDRDGPIHSWGDDEVICLQHSSGTTGLKKGVPLTISAITRQIKNYSAAIRLDPNDAIISWLPLYHDMGFVAAFLMPLLTGNPVVTMSPFDWLADPLSLFDAIERHHGRFTWLPNFAFHHLINSAEGARARDLSRMKAFINCSEPCKSETFAQFLDRFAPWGLRPEQLQVCYAMAETVFAVTQTHLGKPPKTLHISGSAMRDDRVIRFNADDNVAVLSTGRPIDGISVRIDGGQIGEILLQGSFLFEGYFRQDAAVTCEGWYRTGDIGFLYEGELYVLGRQKDLIIVLGKNFLAHELEALIGSVSGVKPGRAVALGAFNPAIGSEDVIIVAELDETTPPASVRRGIRTVLENTVGLVPKTILLVPQGWLIKSTSGKLSRAANLRKFQESHS